MLRLAPFGLIGLLLLLLWVWAIFDVIATDASLVRNLPKTLWLILVIFLPDIGSIAWLLLGRPQYENFTPGGEGPSRRARQPGYKGTGPYGPDSAPRYLAEYELTDRRSQELDAQLEAWERTQGRGGRDLTAWEAELEAREQALHEREQALGDPTGPDEPPDPASPQHEGV
jgi:hypothetical protein